jgi:hypothetical protein
MIYLATSDEMARYLFRAGDQVSALFGVFRAFLPLMAIIIIAAIILPEIERLSTYRVTALGRQIWSSALRFYKRSDGSLQPSSDADSESGSQKGKKRAGRRSKASPIS